MYSTSFGGDENTLGFSGDGWTLFEYTKKKKNTNSHITELYKFTG